MGAAPKMRVDEGYVRVPDTTAGQDSHAVRRLSSPTLIGRARELSLLLEAATSPPALVIVEGEAGIGKSRLVREVVSHSAVRGRRVLIGHCHRVREPFLLGPVVEALRAAGAAPPGRPLSPLVGALRPLLPELAEILPAAPPPIGDARAERHRTFRALRELLGAFGPTVCVLEDLHWTDEGTLEFLSFLVSQPPATLSLVLTYRGEELASASPLSGLRARVPANALEATIELSPLSIDEVGRLASALLGTSAVSEETARHLHEQTAGVPFAVEELIRLLRDRDQLELVDGWGAAIQMERIGVSRPVAQSIRERMAFLGDDARLVARVAAVLGVPASETLVARVAGLSPARAAKGLTKALSGAVLEERPAGLYGFRHVLAAQAVYDEIPGPERLRLHARAADALESGAEPLPLAQLAHHFKEAGRSRQWARYAEAAADAARLVGDDPAAATLLEEALSCPRLSRAAKVRMAAKLGAAAVHSPRPQTAIEPLQRVLDEEPMAVATRGELRYRISRLRYQVGDAGPWREEMARAVEELRERPELAARAMMTLAWPVVGLGDVQDDLAWLRRAVEAAAQSDDPVAKTAVHSQRAAILLSIGDPEGWSAVTEIARDPRSVDGKLQLLRAYQCLTVAALGLGHYRRAEAFLAEVARLERDLDHMPEGPWRESAQISLDWRMGRWEGLESRVRALLQRGAGQPVLSVGNEIVLSSLLLSRNRIEEAERSFASILERAGPRHWMSARIAAAAGLARISLAREDARAADDVAALGLEVIKRKRIWIWGRELVPVAVQALLLRGERAQASQLADEFEAGVERADAPAAAAASSLCLGAVAKAEERHADAVRFFASAARIWAELPSPYEAAWAREAQARCLLAQGEDRGASLLVRALATFEGLQATWDAARVRAELKSRGVALPTSSRGGRKAYGNRLSPREAEVAQLAAGGQTNREIAEALFISPRTVEAHVASALRKLGLESRQALAAGASALDEAKVGTAHES